MLLTNLLLKKTKDRKKEEKIPKRSSEHELKNKDTHFSFGNRNIVLEFVNRSAKSTFGQNTYNNGMCMYVHKICCTQLYIFHYFKSNAKGNTTDRDRK